jgi:sec-independent protein translocase protein TatC
MASPDEPQGDQSPDSPNLPSETPAKPLTPAGDAEVSYSQVTDNAYYASGPTYGSSPPPALVRQTPAPQQPRTPPEPPKPSGSGGGRRSLPPPPGGGDGGDEEDGMLRMSFLGHLEELRMRLFYALGGFGVAFMGSLFFCKQLWELISAPAVQALTTLGIKPPNLTQITPMESFNVIWVKVPVLCSIFIASPWLLYQVWAFVSPGLYKREKKWAVPFVVCTAGLFIAGGLFAYFVAFRFGLTFLLGIGRDVHVSPMVSIDEYFDLFVNVTLGIGLVFEMPILIFFLTLLRLVTPHFLLSHSRYAILIITIIAAVVTPTPDVFNLLLFATPMILLFFVGVFASYLLVLNREGRRFPWPKVLLWALLVSLILGAAYWLIVIQLHVHFLPRWPFFSR